MLALLAIPSYSNIQILSDSQASLDMIGQLVQGTWSTRKLLRASNILILNQLGTLIENKHLTVQLTKVRAHTGIAGNEMADDAAKRTISEGNGMLSFSCSSLDPHSLLKYILAFDHTPIEQNARRFIKTLFSLTTPLNGLN